MAKKIQYGDYIIHDNGVIVSMKTSNAKRLNGSYNNCGYHQTTINGKNQLTHRLIAMLFVPNPNNLPCVNHIDGDKKNNHALNLEWVTYSENMKHAVHVGLKVVTIGSNCSWSKIDEYAAQLIKHIYNLGATQKRIGNAFGLSQSTISCIVNNKTWHHG